MLLNLLIKNSPFLAGEIKVFKGELVGLTDRFEDNEQVVK
jgi:hypothetical protein